MASDIPISCLVVGLHIKNASSNNADWASWYAKDVYKYTRDDGASCGSVFIFNRSVNSGKKCTRAQFTVMPGFDYVNLLVDLGRSVKDNYSLVLDQLDHDMTMTLSTQPIDIGKGAWIMFTGHGAVPGKTGVNRGLPEGWFLSSCCFDSSSYN